MAEKCSNPDCAAPPHCHEGHDDYTKCEFWLKNNSVKVENLEKPKKVIKKTNITWTGEPFKIEEVEQVSKRTTPYFHWSCWQSSSRKNNISCNAVHTFVEREKV